MKALFIASKKYKTLPCCPLKIKKNSFLTLSVHVHIATTPFFTHLAEQGA
jgi:hypothetical protein